MVDYLLTTQKDSNYRLKRIRLLVKNPIIFGKKLDSKKLLTILNEISGRIHLYGCLRVKSKQFNLLRQLFNNLIFLQKKKKNKKKKVSKKNKNRFSKNLGRTVFFNREALSVRKISLTQILFTFLSS